MSTDAGCPTHDPSPGADPDAGSAGGRAAAFDPVRARRAQVARWTKLANQLGWACFGVAVAAFALTFAVGFSGGMSALIIGAVVAGTVLLAPAIVLGYAVKAAERDDRERGL